MSPTIYKCPHSDSLHDKNLSQSQEMTDEEQCLEAKKSLDRYQEKVISSVSN